ncbi:sugar ABC transporter ATP-binding protein [Arthrobacter sp. S39]|uniref:sugar ABC transporter ATP-binding protein n=1 Tax=Arthrobacter sp. S39 TaxID=2509720 RepID=UPI0010376BC7|nr:sugar ABC transporter ATP-binding protein [Arthrobacter sp. S39]TAP39574.1 sugar ABC transporter ATP-binding protein [Arthrobacter sp. S39]
MLPTTTSFGSDTAEGAFSPPNSAVLELRRATKKFGAVTALTDVSIELMAGECLVLLGENGAGKSTLVGAILGRHPLTEGQLLIRGEQVEHYSPHAARQHGVRAVTQEFSLCESLPVYANLFVGQEPQRAGFLRKGFMRTEARRRLTEVDATFSETDAVSALTRAEQQLVEICKAVTQDSEPGVILFDEPTAAISATEAQKLFGIIDRLKTTGWAIVYISHRMEELRRVGDRVVVLRDGRQVSTHHLADVDDRQLINEMAGRDLDTVHPAKAQESEIGKPVLSVDQLATSNGKVLDVSFELRAGEILGIGGLVGSGKGDVASAIFGLEPLTHGKIHVGGQPVSRPTPRTMYRLGFGFLAEDRKREGILPETSVAANIMVERLAISRTFSRAGFQLKRKLQNAASHLISEFDVRPAGALRMPIGQLSGGNQQKALVARALSTPRKVLVVVEPTAGVDIGSRMEIYRHLRAKCQEEGIGILLVSSDVEELVGMCDRVVVMNTGRITTALIGADITPDNIVAASFGTTEENH